MLVGLGCGTLMGVDEKTIEVCDKWEQFCFDMMHTLAESCAKEGPDS